MRKSLLIYIAVVGGIILSIIVACSAKPALVYAPDDLSASNEAGYWYLRLQSEAENPAYLLPPEAVDSLLATVPPVGVYTEIAEHFWRRGHTEETKAILEDGRSNYPDNFNLVGILAEVYMATQNAEQAQQVMLEFLRANPGDSEAAVELLSLFVRNNNFKEAVAAVKSIPGKDRSAEIYYWAAKAYNGLNQPAQAVSELRKSVSMDPTAVESWTELGYALELAHDLKGAENAYSHVLNMGEENEELVSRIIELNLKLKNPSRAYSVLSAGPDTVGFKLKTSMLFMEAGQYEYSSRIINDLLKRPDAPPEVAFFGAYQAVEKGRDFSKAVEFLDRIPKDSPEYVRAMRFKSAILLESGNTQAAIELARQMRRQYPEDRESWMHEASIYANIEDYQSALLILSQAMEKWPDDVDLIFAVGEAFTRLGQDDKALTLMEKVLMLEPDHPEAMNNIGYTLIEQNRDFQRAERLLTRAVAIKPDSGYIIDSLAWLYYKQGRLPEAWKTIQDAVRKQDLEAVIWEHYGDIAATLGKKKEAAKGYRKALDLKPVEPAELMRKLKNI